MNLLLSIVQNLIVTGIVAIISFIGGLSYTKVRAWLKFRQFSQVFGTAAASSKSVFICHTLWQVLPSSRNEIRFLKHDFDGTPCQYHGPDELIASDDVRATTQIEALFYEFYKEPIEIVWDTQKNINDLRRRSGVFIGHFSNLRTSKLLLDSDISFLKFEEASESDDHPTSLLIQDKQDHTLFSSTGKKEYAVIIRIPNPGSPREAFFFLVFGAHSTGTFAALKYLRENWQEFTKASPTCGLVLEMPRSTPDMVTVRKRYGFPATGQFP
jgi:hypothetical protein